MLMANKLICRCTICKDRDQGACAGFAGKLGVETGEQKDLVEHDYPNVQVRSNFEGTQNNCNSRANFTCRIERHSICLRPRQTPYAAPFEASIVPRKSTAERLNAKRRFANIFLRSIFLPTLQSRSDATNLDSSSPDHQPCFWSLYCLSRWARCLACFLPPEALAGSTLISGKCFANSVFVA